MTVGAPTFGSPTKKGSQQKPLKKIGIKKIFFS
jgi:hypothetical protein